MCAWGCDPEVRHGADRPEYRGNRPRSTQDLEGWHAVAPREAVLDPLMPIVDAHHHIFGTAADPHFYRLQDLGQDVAGGHHLIGTVWVEAYEVGWRTDGPPELRSVGEVEGVVRLTSTPVHGEHGHCDVAAGMVSNVDLMLGDRVVPVLEAHVEAAAGRLRGVRHHAMHDEGKVGSYVKNSRPCILAEPSLRRGVARLDHFDLTFDALVYHPQIDEVADLADAFPDLTIILNHMGQVLGVADFAPRREAVRAQWERAMRSLALRPNVHVKIGGMGMPMFGFGFEAGAAPATSQTLAQAWQPYIDLCLEAFGSERCMFESNFPVDKQSCSYTALWNAFKLATRSLSESERRDLFYRSACRAYRLPGLQATGDGIAVQG